MKRLQPYEKVGLTAAEVLIAVDVLMALKLDDAAIDLMSTAARTDTGLIEMVKRGADEADRRAIRKRWNTKTDVRGHA